MTVNAQAARENIARTIAAWLGYSWDGLSEYSIVERQVGEWWRGAYQGGKPDLLRLADALMAHPRPELGREITDEMIERGARAHCPFAFEAGTGTDWMRESARAEARKEVREILTAALSVTRPERGNRYCAHDDCPYPDCLVDGLCPSAVTSHNAQKAQP